MPNQFNDARFGVAPMRSNIQRSNFPIKTKRLFTGNAGDLIPFYWKAVVPGDTIKIDTSAVVRMQTPLYPVFDDAVIDYYYFYVPERIVWDHFKEFIGEDLTSAWESPTEYVQPKTTAPAETGWKVGTIADYLGFRTGTPGIWGQSTLFRSYVKIWNDWFRDENLQDPAMLHTDDRTTTGSNGDTYITDAEKGGKPLKANKIKNDPFVSALPSTQKGLARLIPVSNEVAPVFTAKTNIPMTLDGYSDAAKKMMERGSEGLTWNQMEPLWWGQANPGTWENPPYQIPNLGNHPIVTNYNSWHNDTHVNNGSQGTLGKMVLPVNLFADIQSSIGTINDLRTSIALQQMLEAYRRGGTRYREILASVYQVTIPDSTVQIREYLCGSRIPVNMDQVLQTSATQDGTTPLGETGAFSNTAFKEFSFEKGITEFGYIMGVCVVRRLHASYSQGVPFLSQRQTKWDYFNPYFVHLGEEPIYNKYIFAQGTDEDDEVMGYNERYYMLSYDPNMIMGEFRPDYSETLDAWHYGDNYETLPTLSSEWIQEDKSVFDRTLAVSSGLSHQFMFDFWLDGYAIRPMPAHRIPGLERL